MIKSFLGISLGSGATGDLLSETFSQGKITPDQIRILVDFFPIGKVLHYYPEFKKEIVLDTFVVAYCVNGHFVYSADAIERNVQGEPTFFHTGGMNERTPVVGLKSFQLLVPDTSDLEMKLDYYRRALIGRGRQFNKGNYISLISNAGGRGVSTVDTEVAKKVALPDGPYAQTDMILLTPELNTLTVTDQRKKARAKTCVPVMLILSADMLSAPCTIVDMSDDAVRLRVRERDSTMPVMRQGDEVILEIDLGEAKQCYTIKGVVLRRSLETCSIQLKGLLRDGKYGSFGPLDFLQLKAGLLNYGV